MNEIVVSWIRTVVPHVVGMLVTVAAGYDIAIDGPSLELVAVGALASAYYALVRMAEARWPKAGWLLGYPAAPTYEGGGKR
ncbi:MAG: hypothetical protein GY708_20650 [Actinomycetia bacterium]|nr:hypothetical protein [Actinomycetes bacterium]